ncbi:hypothetical protein BGZ79_001040 [Entomortierella chlamydospora]|nr:hypothetical protein BGZ79_001040 [Entomortierella chlamydospora]
MKARGNSIPVFAVNSDLQVAAELGVDDFVCIGNGFRIPAYVDRCRGVAKAFQDARINISANIAERVIYADKARNDTQLTVAQIIAGTVLHAMNATSVVYLSAPFSSDIGLQLPTVPSSTEAVAKDRAEVQEDEIAETSESRTRQYGIVFMDIWMPVLSGHEALMEIRGKIQGMTKEELSIVAMTACVTPGDQENERVKVKKEREVLHQCKLIQKKKREIFRKRTLAMLMNTGTGDVEESIRTANAIADNENEDED